MKCCDKYTSKFCPECGADLGNHPLRLLLDHCKSVLGPIRQRLERINCRNQADIENIRKHERVKLACVRRVEKWESWIAALEAAIRGNDTTGDNK